MNPDSWEIECEREEGNKVTFSVSIPSDDVDEQRKQAMNELKQKVDEPGFRQGKVPDSIIEKKYEPQLKQAVLEKLVPIACQNTYQRHDIQPIAEPSIEDFDLDDDFYMEATVEEQPSVDVDEEDYLDIPVEKTERETDEDAVDDHIDRMLEDAASLEATDEDRPVETGDFVKINFRGLDEDGNVVEGTEAEGTAVEVGSERFLPEIEQAIEGEEVGAELETEASFPDDFVDDNLAGETLTFEVEIIEIQEQQKPDPDDEEFLEEMGADSLEDLKDKVREQLDAAGDQEAEEELADQVYDHLIETVDLEVPESLLEREIDNIIQQQKQQLEQQGREFEDYLEEQGQTEEEMREMAADEAERRIKLTLIFQAIADQEDISVTDEEFENHLAQMAAQYGVDVDELKQQFPEQQLDNIRFELRDQNVLDYLIEQADVETVAPEESEEEPVEAGA